jgi:outer membrane receptor protein involved in Fe transport
MSRTSGFGLRASVGVVVVLVGTASAQPPGTVSDVEVPQVIVEPTEPGAAAGDEALDLANVVQSAAKGVTTVQEAPAIVTVITADEIRDRQFESILDIASTVPGWMETDIYFSEFPHTIVRGQSQAVQFLHDGVSLFDPFQNIPAINRSQPIELIKRVEMITGPGGVLWGSNSLLGIMNIITKDAEDVEGAEMGVTAGHAPGDRMALHVYAMGGKSDLLNGKLKLFGHASVETFQGADEEMPLLLFHETLPQPNSANTYGPLTHANQPQSYIITIDGKLTYGKLQLRAYAPFGQEYHPFGLSGEPVRANVSDPNDPTGNQKLGNRADHFDRYLVGEYRTRFANDKAGITLRAYGMQFIRNFEPLQVLAPSLAVPGGLAFNASSNSFRAGAALDGDAELARSFRVLYGGEAFTEWIQNDSSKGIQLDILGPTDLTRLPFLCPRIYDTTQMKIVPVPTCPTEFAFPENRTVFSGYVDPQWRPTKTLIFDAGARVSVAPASLGSLSYAAQPTFAGTVVWEFVKNWHIKLNYAEGFRPPVFNNSALNGEAVAIAGSPNLKVETSNAAQAEINARIFKGDRQIRELSFRADASYTRLNNQILVSSGAYGNTGTRGIASAEFLGKLYVKGGHRVELGYTYLQVDSSDKGYEKSLPHHWFDLATVFSLVPSKLSATTDLRVYGATQDPNRLVDYRGIMGPINVAASDLVLDRIPPIAELSLGLAYSPVPRFAIRATVHDALGGHYYQPDIFFDYEPHLEYLPNPYAGIRAYVSAFYQY